MNVPAFLRFPRWSAVVALLAAQPAVPGAVVDLNTPRAFPAIESRSTWESRARDIRRQALVTCGLWPMPDKSPLRPRIFGRIEREDYTVEKVYLETRPGFFLGGNLYRPKGKGPFPAVLNPHGHWSNGRLADTPEGSIPGRCISFARQGMIAFSWDMLGYNDTVFAQGTSGQAAYNVHRQFDTNHANLLWNIHSMGVQTWNSIRALDFLLSLEEVDPKRVAITGESGGGTQTFMLGAIEDRLRAQAPVVMVSHTMQGGCSCENAPGLRVEYSNMEIAAAAAPRPQLLVAATGDWTRATLEVEGPAIARVYALLGQPGRFDYKRFDYGHNYNRESREAVYGFFGRWVLNHQDPASLTERPFRKEADADLRVFPDLKLPEGALTQEAFVEQLKVESRRRWAEAAPGDRRSLAAYRENWLPVWRHTLVLQTTTPPNLEVAATGPRGGVFSADVRLRLADAERALEAVYFAPERVARAPRLVIVSGGDSEPFTDAAGGPMGLARRVVDSGSAVLAIRKFSGETPADQFSNFYSGYNRTLVQQRVRDLVALCEAAPGLDPRGKVPFRVMLVGMGDAGLWSLLAAPAADAVAADAGAFDPADEGAWLENRRFCPGILNLGGFEGVAMLAAPKPMFICNARGSLASLKRAFEAARHADALRVENGPVETEPLVAWIKEARL